MNRIALKYSARKIQPGDIRLEIQSMLIERDERGGRPHPYFSFINMNGAGHATLSVDLELEEWEKIIGKLQKKIGQMKGAKSG